VGVLTVILIIAVLLVLWAIAVYNGLVKSKNIVDNGWSQIEAQLQRRFDLIPNLVSTVKGYAAHEKDLFEGIAQAKERMVSAGSVSEKGEASKEVSNSLKSIFALSEAYPELKANENFLRLQEDLKGTEDKIAFSRQFYNDSVTRYNTKLELFPSNIFANMFGMVKREYFALENSAARENVKVEF
jgi:LemA protein